MRETASPAAELRRKAIGLTVSLVSTALLLALPCPALAFTYLPSAVIPPKPAREFRAMWIATVANLDWPSTNSLNSTAAQKAELLAMLDRAVQLKLNVVIFQVRPACDALYASSLEPWSEYLTGTMGKPPEPYYDPLAFAIEEAHKRGLELHTWFNPFRARHLLAKSAISPGHISRRRPDLVRHIGATLWLDPGQPDAQEYSLNIIMDVVRRYDIDGVHFDDYFYPYPEKDAAVHAEDFPDGPSWQQFGAGGKLSRDDWRRANINRFVQRVYTSIKATKPWVKFGISPFGIWRPKNPAQIKGFDAYEGLYADSRLWLANGWVDYFAPQLYWPIALPEQSFPALLKWWSAENVKHRVLCPGLNTYKVGRDWKAEEILNQIRLIRKLGASGHIHWRAATLMQDPALDARLEREVYQVPALPQAMPQLGMTNFGNPVLVPHISPKTGSIEFDFKLPRPGRPWLWIFQTRKAGDWSTQILPGNRVSALWKGSPPDAAAVSPVDRNGNLGRATAVELRK
jgi:uncharacterized lipoprotein YddW (UPF0748 family)